MQNLKNSRKPSLPHNHPVKEVKKQRSVIAVKDFKDVIDQVITPAFVLDADVLQHKLAKIQQIKAETNCKILYALKPLTNVDALRLMAPHVNGFSASSLFEATLAREMIADKGSVHITTPGYLPDEINALARVCDYISLNSLNQYSRYRNDIFGKAKLGLRINPQLSFVKDKKYNPCRKFSKLGIPLNQFVDALKEKPNFFKGISGIQFHSNCDSKTFTPLLKTISHLDQSLGKLFGNLEWLNLGGGYLLKDTVNLNPFYKAINFIHSKYDLDIFFEPGAALVRDAGMIIATVIDLFVSSGNTIAVLDTTINHMQEIFEYQFEPDVLGHQDNGRYWYTLAGSTCLAGDVFGQYAFDHKLKIGSRIVFTGMGAYTQVKAHMFNGVNLPSIYLMQSHQLKLRRRFTYQDFLSRCGG